MNATIGYVLVLLGLACAVFGAVVGLFTGLVRQERGRAIVQWCVYGFAVAMVLANVVMVKALLEHDFTVLYVSRVGSIATPTIFTIVSLWSALEGSILFWGAILGIYVIVFALMYRGEHSRYMQLTLGVICAVAAFFAFLIAAPAQPWFHPGFFWSAPPIPPDFTGPGPNPLLQNHVLMIIHPPMLYLGYVGMTIPFGIAAGALLRGELGDAWLVPLRKWTLVPWIFLTIGIILGMWWAYAVLGWGGYWAWDPVENASFLPWLTSTAFMHSTMVLERKRSLKFWTVALAMGSFVLTVLGTFMTRSGVFNSVHSFTKSDIGPTFLGFIAVVLVFSIIALSMRGHLLVAESPLESLRSREGSILINNVVFVTMTFTVLMGTMYPLVTEAVEKRRISVGPQYFNSMALPLGLLMLFLMGVGPMLPWGKSSFENGFRKQLVLPGTAALIVAALVFAAGIHGGLELATFACAAFVVTVTIRELALPASQLRKAGADGLWRSVVMSASRAPRRFGGYIVHLGIVMIVVAIAASSALKQQTTASLVEGESLTVGDWKVRFDGFAHGKEPHREWVAANVTLTSPSGESTSFAGMNGPRMNYYERSNDPIGSPLVHSMAAKDVYVSVIHMDPEHKRVGLNTFVFPLVAWIWYSIPILVLGTLIALFPQRRKQETAASVPANIETSGAS